jgi:hypothetical protein
MLEVSWPIDQSAFMNMVMNLRRGRPRKTWRRTIEEEITEMGKTWSEVKALANQRRRWRSFTGALCSIRNKRN